MKYLSDYTEKEKDEAFDKAGAFFAFTDKQLEKKKREGVKYVNMGHGLICPKDNADQLFKDLEIAHLNGIKKDKEENGKEEIILRELYNHETFHCGGINDAIDALRMYGYSREEIFEVYREEYKKLEKKGEL